MELLHTVDTPEDQETPDDQGSHLTPDAQGDQRNEAAQDYSPERRDGFAIPEPGKIRPQRVKRPVNKFV